jgi:uncharacterized membrane protein YeaQ/YmgE (transglycosylase-associated protein family)
MALIDEYLSMDLNEFLSHPSIRQLGLWLFVGLGTGLAAKLILPGSENMGWIRTILFGFGGSFLGNYLAPHLFQWPQYNPVSTYGIGMGIGGALVLVLVNRLVTKS